MTLNECKKRCLANVNVRVFTVAHIKEDNQKLRVCGYLHFYMPVASPFNQFGSTTCVSWDSFDQAVELAKLEPVNA